MAKTSSNRGALGAIYLVAFIDMLGFGIIIPVIRDYTILLTELSGYATKNYALLSGVLMASYSFFQFLDGQVS